MYYQFFGLQKNPFSMTPDPSSLFLTAAHREAIAGLTYGAFSRKGFVVLSGEAGTGKTTLLRRLVELSKESNARCSVVFNPLLSPEEFLELLLYNFGLRDMPASKTQRLLKLEELLLETHRARKTAVLIVDEAHKLSHAVFEEIRLLTNFETGEDKLLQIVLAGQPELKSVLNHPHLWQLKQRIAVRLQIEPLAPRQVGAFIAYRWNRFGGGDPHPFSKDAVTLIALWSRGIPRLVNSICDSALLLAFSLQVRKVGAEEILEVARDLDLPAPLDEMPGEPPPPVGKIEPEDTAKIRPAPPEPNGHFNGHANGNGNGNGHKVNGMSNADAVTRSPEPAAPSTPETGSPSPAIPDLLLDSERVRAQAATRPRPSPFQRSERTPLKPPVSAVSAASLTPPPPRVAAPDSNGANALREPVRLRKLARHDPEPRKMQPRKLPSMLSWLGRFTPVAAGRLAPIHQFIAKWRKK